MSKYTFGNSGEIRTELLTRASKVYTPLQSGKSSNPLLTSDLEGALANIGDLIEYAEQLREELERLAKKKAADREAGL